MSILKIRDIYGYTGAEVHPAHGPLREERLRQVSEILSKATTQRDGGSLGHAMADAVKAIGELNAAKLRIAELESRTITLKLPLPDVLGLPPLYAQNRTMEAVFAAAALTGVRIQIIEGGSSQGEATE